MLQQMPLAERDSILGNRHEFDQSVGALHSSEVLCLAGGESLCVSNCVTAALLAAASPDCG